MSDSLSPLSKSSSSDDNSELPSFPDDIQSIIDTSDSEKEAEMEETSADNSAANAFNQDIQTPLKPRLPLSFKIVGDNVDKTIKPREETSEHHNTSLHYFHSYCVRDRVDTSALHDNAHLPDTDGLNTLDILPSDDDRTVLQNNMAIMAGNLYMNKSIIGIISLCTLKICIYRKDS